MSMDKTQKNFDLVFGQRFREWRRSYGWSLVLRGGLGLVVAFFLLAGADAWLAFPDGVRFGLLVGLLLGLGFWLVGVGWYWWRLSPVTFAREADRLGKFSRQTILAGWEISEERSGKEKDSAPAMAEFCQQEALRKGGRALRAFQRPGAGKYARVRRAFREIQLGGLGMILLVGLFWTVFSVTLPRLLMPWQDRPPYSPLEFLVEPFEPVRYGDTLDMRVQIQGGEVRDPVDVLLRDGTGISRTGAFSEGNGHYGQTLENVTRPLEVAFTTGRARSDWYPVDLQYDPRVVLARAEVTPPAYTGKERQTFTLGEQGLRVWEGSRVELTVSSNRPLQGGELVLSPESEEGQTESRAGELSGSHAVRFGWEATETAALEVTLYDLQGTPSRKPLAFSQTVRIDEPPTVVLSVPGVYALATPDSQIPIEGYASDDLGLASVDLVRSVEGYRDRSVSMNISPGERHAPLAKTLDLDALGVVPGEVLELFFEAWDQHPEGRGMTVSQIARIEIIATEDYAGMVLQRATIQQFAEEMRRLREIMDELVETLDEVAKMGDEEISPAQQERLEEKYAEAREHLKDMQERFHPYDAEQGAQEVLEQLDRRLEGQANTLSELTPGSEDWQEMAESFRDAFSGSDEEESLMEAVASHEAMAAHLAEAETLMRLTREFRRMAQEQASIARRLADMEWDADLRVVSRIKFLEQRQEKLGNDLKAWVQGVEKAALEIDEGSGVAELRESALDFIALVRDYEISLWMERTRRDIEMERIPVARAAAEATHARMQALLEEAANQGSFGEMCAGGTPGFQNAPQDLQRTLEQMARGLQRGGSGTTGQYGSGGGGSGEGDNGYFVESTSPFDGIPAYGPQGTPWDPSGYTPGSGAGGTGSGTGSGRGHFSSGEVTAMETESVGTEDRGELTLEQAPERYREALQRYFNQIESL
ncbi:MAG: hypothetical protein LAT58_07590 [Opitutales bacterium]|nr:hypothetical protein [Opitutales bacterium]